MVAPTLLLLAAAAGLASAHFQLEYPPWRADSLNNDSYSQYTYPCAGVPSDAVDGGNRTDWPVAGGALQLNVHHNWSYIFVNIGLGDNAANFNYSLTPSFWNATGKGILCVPQLDLPAGLAPADGQRGSLQVVTVTASGEALYNCADITFRTGAVAAFGGHNCTTTDGVRYTLIGDYSDGGNTSTSESAPAAATNTSSSTTTSGASRALPAGVAAWTGVTALAVVFACGLNA